MAHSGSHKEAHPVALIFAHLVEDRVVIPDGVFRRDARIGPAVGQQQLSTVRLEFADVGIDGVDVA